LYFFFLAEDGIRDFHVTGVQTCALPISRPTSTNWFRSNTSGPGKNTWPPAPTTGCRRKSTCRATSLSGRTPTGSPKTSVASSSRSEERRVGKERQHTMYSLDKQNKFSKF